MDMEQKEVITETNEKKSKKSKGSLATKIIIVLSLLVVVICSFYLYKSLSLVKKYDVDKIKIGEHEIATLNGVLKKNRKLVYASEGDIITLKYEIEGMTLNNVYEYLGELSSEGYVVWNLEELYMRIVNVEKDVQVRIRVGSNHLVIEYNIGIDKNEKIKIGEDQTKDLVEDKSKEKTETE